MGGELRMDHRGGAEILPHAPVRTEHHREVAPECSEATTVSLAADVSIAMTDAPDPVNAGASLTYTVTVNNLGPDPATNVVVTDTLPAAVSYISDTCGGAEGP